MKDTTVTLSRVMRVVHKQHGEKRERLAPCNNLPSGGVPTKRSFRRVDSFMTETDAPVSINAENVCPLTVIETKFLGGGGGWQELNEAALPPTAAASSFPRSGRKWMAHGMVGMTPTNVGKAKASADACMPMVSEMKIGYEVGSLLLEHPRRMDTSDRLVASCNWSDQRICRYLLVLQRCVGDKSEQCDLGFRSGSRWGGFEQWRSTGRSSKWSSEVRYSSVFGTWVGKKSGQLAGKEVWALSQHVDEGSW